MSDDIILDDDVEDGRLVTLAEVKNMLEKAQDGREELTYEQKIALEHARRFARTNMTTAKKIVKALTAAYPAMDEKFAVRMADLVPQHEDDVMAILQKAHMDLDEGDAAKIIAIIDEHYVA